VADRNFDAIVVGAGFAGLHMLHKLRGIGLSARVIEAGSDVGGTWYWNRYPGARCDIESMEYCYSFDAELEQEWRWTERYATQPEILSYLQHVADRFDLRRDISLSTRVTAATFDEATSRWTVDTDDGAALTARFCIMATGCLSVINRPDLPGLAEFEGPVYQTGLWPHEGVDFTGQAVAVIGTGSSAVQTIPAVARQAESLTVFQRTPNFVAPANNHAMSEAYEADFKRNYKAKRQDGLNSYFGIVMQGDVNAVPAMSVPNAKRTADYQQRWDNGGLSILGTFPDLLFDRAANDTLADFVRGKIREKVAHPDVAERLCPKDHPIGSKRMCVDTGYFETFNAEHVTLVDIRAEPIERFTAGGISTSAREFSFDAIVLATGFDAMTGALARIAITGRGGRTLAEHWRDGPRTYLGLACAGFPNLFLITGPGSPSVLSNMIVSIEQHVGWISDCLATLTERGATTFEATAEAEQAWVDHGAAVAAPTVYPEAKSWYTGANVADKPRVFMAYIGGVPGYRAICSAVARSYAGFAIDGQEAPAPVDFMAVLTNAPEATAA
jgi:cyclohexanone monooxygenase